MVIVCVPSYFAHSIWNSFAIRESPFYLLGYVPGLGPILHGVLFLIPTYFDTLSPSSIVFYNVFSNCCYSNNWDYFTFVGILEAQYF